MLNKYQQLADRISSATSIALFAHQRPDGDAIGSVLGMKHLIVDNFVGKEVTTHILDEVPEVFSFLPGFEKISPTASLDVDLIIILDIGAFHRTGLIEGQLEQLSHTTVVNIDHHPSEEESADLHIVETDRSSVCELLAIIAGDLGWDVSPNASEALLTGIYTDTGSFQHTNTTAQSLSIAARLVENGADLNRVTRAIFKSNSLSYIQDLGKHLMSSQLIGRAVVGILDPNEKHSYELKGELAALINGTVDGQYTVVLMQDGDVVRGSFRSKTDAVDVSIYAHRLGGGGHKQAAAFKFAGQIITDDAWMNIEMDGDMMRLQEFIDKIES